MKGKFAEKALYRLLKPQKKKILEMGWESLEEFIEALKQVPRHELDAKLKELKQNKKVC